MNILFLLFLLVGNVTSIFCMPQYRVSTPSGDVMLTYDQLVQIQRKVIVELSTERKDNKKLDEKTLHEVGIKKIVDTIPTQTLMGKSLVHSALATYSQNPQSVDQARNKQHYCENSAKMKKYSKLLGAAQAGEKVLLDLWTEEKNKSEAFAQKYRSSFGAEHASWRNCAFLGLDGLLALFPGSNLLNAWNEKDYLTSSLFMGAYAVELLGTKLDYDYRVKRQGNATLGKSLMWLGAAFYAAGAGSILYGKRNQSNDVEVHQGLIDIASYMQVAERIYNDNHQDVQFQQAFPDFCKSYKTLCDNPITKPIIDDLKASTFQGSPSAFSNAGRISLVAERLMKHKELFLPIMRALGEIDEYTAMNKFKKQQSRLVMTHPSASKEHGAWVKAYNFVYPGVTNCTPNSIALGKDVESFIDVTGPNACGKSFANRGLLANLVLSGVYGFALADEFEHSYFDGGVQYIANVTDSTGFASLYEAEINSLLKDSYEKSHILKKNGELAITVIDEAVKATEANAGAEVAALHIETSIEEKLAHHNAQIFITHHKLRDIKGLGHFCVEDGANRYQLRPGVSRYTNAVEKYKKALEKIKKELDQETSQPA